MRALFYKFAKNAAECFRGYNPLWQLLAVFLTYIAVSSGFDWFYFILLRNSAWYPFLFPAAIAGFLLPILVPLTMLAVGTARKNMRTVNAAWGTGQAALLGLLFSFFYKTFTGRIQPPSFLTAGTLDISNGFRFGFLRGGVFWGWPSSHTTVAFAAAVALITLCPENKFIKYVALAYAVYVGIGVSMGIHWFSDVAAGAIFGSLIGIAVGNSFRERIGGA